MRAIKMEFARAGDDPSVLTKGQPYHVFVDSTRHRQFTMPLSQEEFLDRLAELRYQDGISAAEQAASLASLGAIVTTVLEPPDEATAGDDLQLDVVTNAQELWALPFEAARTADGQPLFARRDHRVVLTRRVAQPFAEQQPAWPARPRVLFVYASPAWTEAVTVPASAHKAALLEALQPWVDPVPGLPVLVGQEESVLTTLEDATVGAIAEACRLAESRNRPYTHIHLLAHGVLISDPLRPHRSRYGIALESADNTVTAPEAIVEAIRPSGSGATTKPDLPVVVTLAICDGGNAANSSIKAGGLAQALHRSGVPIVIASQLPLTFPGSEIMTRVFYAAWLKGKDVRQALHDTRVALYEGAGTGTPGHDWISMVAYVRLTEGYRGYLDEVRLASELAALETASKYARDLLERNITDAFQCDQVTRRLQVRVASLEASLVELDAAGRGVRKSVIQENGGLLGSALKRLAELLAWRANAAPADRAHWIGESRAAAVKARDAYQAAFRRDPSNHWTGVQYLALDAALSGRIANGWIWLACYDAAMEQSHDQDAQTRIWACGSLAELSLLAPLAAGTPPDITPAPASLKTLADLVIGLGPDAFSDVSPIDSTRRQLLRYVDWWTTANGFFPDRENDLSAAAQTLAAQLSA